MKPPKLRVRGGFLTRLYETQATQHKFRTPKSCGATRLAFRQTSAPPVHLQQQAPHLLQCPAIDRAMLRRRRTAVTALLAATATASSEWGEWGPPPPPPPPPPQQQQPPPQYDPQQQGGYYGEQQPQYDQQQPQRPPGPPPPKPPAGPILARVSSVVSGAGVGCGIGKCITGNASPRFAAAGAVSCFLSCCVGGRFGDAALALGQTTVGAVKKSRALRDGRYPVFRQFKAGLGLVSREPWPPGAPATMRRTAAVSTGTRSRTTRPSSSTSSTSARRAFGSRPSRRSPQTRSAWPALRRRWRIYLAQ